jgi:SnoaL-like domain
VTSIEDELKRLTDLEAIRHLNAVYNVAMDSRDRAGFARCWTADAVGGRYGTDLRQEGRDAIVDFAISFPVEGRHICTDAIVEVDGDTARQRIYCLYVDMGPPFDVSMFGMYHDKLVRTPEGWKFQERMFQPFFLRASEVKPSNLAKP